MKLKKLLYLFFVLIPVLCFTSGCSAQNEKRENEEIPVTVGFASNESRAEEGTGNESQKEPENVWEADASENVSQIATMVPEGAAMEPENTAGAAEDTEINTATAPPEKPEVVGPEAYRGLVLADNSDYYVEIAEVDPDGFFGFTVIFNIENRTTSAKTFFLEKETINGLYQPSYWNITVEAGDKAYGEAADWGSSPVYGKEVTELCFELAAFGSEGSDEYASAAETSNITVICSQTLYPMGVAEAECFEYEASENDIRLVDIEECRVTLLDSDLNASVFELSFLVENKSDRALSLFAHDTSLNSIMSQVNDYAEVPAGLSAIYNARWYLDSEELKNVSEVLKAHFECIVADAEDWYGDYLADESIDVFPLGVEAAASVDMLQPAEGEMLLDNDRMVLTVTGYEYDSNAETYVITTDIVNRSEQAFNLDFSNILVNDFSTDIWTGTTVNAYSRTKIKLEIDFSSFKSYFEELVKLEFTLNAADYSGTFVDNESGSFIQVEVLTFYPLGEEIAEKLGGYNPEEGTELLFDNAGVAAYVTGYSHNSSDAFNAEIYFENQNDHPVEVYCCNSYLDGQELYVYLWLELPAGAKRAATLTWDSYYTDGAGIEIDNVERIDLLFQISNPDDWEAGAIDVDAYMNPDNVVHEEQ